MNLIYTRLSQIKDQWDRQTILLNTPCVPAGLGEDGEDGGADLKKREAAFWIPPENTYWS